MKLQSHQRTRRHILELAVPLTKRACFRHETTSEGKEVEICGLVIVAEACQLRAGWDRSAISLDPRSEDLLIPEAFPTKAAGEAKRQRGNVISDEYRRSGPSSVLSSGRPSSAPGPGSLNPCLFPAFGPLLGRPWLDYLSESFFNLQQLQQQLTPSIHSAANSPTPFRLSP